MSRYIDADAVIEAMGEEPYVWNDDADEIAERNQWLTDMNIIESAPSIDIVRCKECRHGTYCEEAEMYICNANDQDLYEAEHFCSYGERNEQ